MKATLPHGWKMEALNSIAEITMGQSPPSSTYNEKQIGLPFFQGKAEFGKKYPVTKKYCSEPIRIAEKDDILMSVRAPVGPVNLSPGKCCFGRGLCRIRSDNKKLDSLYLFFYLRSIEKNLSYQGQGSTFGAIGRDDIERIMVPYPTDGKTQKIIVSMLEKVEELRELRKRADELTKTYLKAIFQEMFGDPVRNNKNMKFSMLGEICTSIKDGPHVSPNYVEKGIPFLSVNNIIKGEWDLDNARFISRDDYLKFKKQADPQKGDVLYTKGGTTGFAKFVDIDIEFCNWVHLAVLKFDKNEINGRFLEAMLNSAYCYKQSQHYTRGIANRDLVLGQMRKIKVMVPPIELQNKFGAIVEQIERMRTYQKQSRQHFSYLLESLIQKAFKGELVC